MEGAGSGLCGMWGSRKERGETVSRQRLDRKNDEDLVGLRLTTEFRKKMVLTKWGSNWCPERGSPEGILQWKSHFGKD